MAPFEVVIDVRPCHDALEIFGRRVVVARGAQRLKKFLQRFSRLGQCAHRQPSGNSNRATGDRSQDAVSLPQLIPDGETDQTIINGGREESSTARIGYWAIGWDRCACSTSVMSFANDGRA